VPAGGVAARVRDRLGRAGEQVAFVREAVQHAEGAQGRRVLGPDAGHQHRDAALL
jgi:hypothetical protein